MCMFTEMVCTSTPCAGIHRAIYPRQYIQAMCLQTKGRKQTVPSHGSKLEGLLLAVTPFGSFSIPETQVCSSSLRRYWYSSHSISFNDTICKETDHSKYAFKVTRKDTRKKGRGSIQNVRGKPWDK